MRACAKSGSIADRRKPARRKQEPDLPLRRSGSLPSREGRRLVRLMNTRTASLFHEGMPRRLHRASGRKQRVSEQLRVLFEGLRAPRVRRVRMVEGKK